MRELARLTVAITEAPWSLRPSDLTRARDTGLSDEVVLHVVVLSALFGHFNRMADAVGVELDYPGPIQPPHAEPATPPYLRPNPHEPAAWPDPDAPRALELSMRPVTAEALATWRTHALLRDAPLTRPQRTLIAHAVAERLGDVATMRELQPLPAVGPLEGALIAATDTVTLAPWRLGKQTVDGLRAAGLVEDEAVFDALATASGCTVFSRIRVALAALGR